jgi:hypothetical protein
MKNVIILIFTFLSVSVLSGCSSMNKDECELANWQAMGYQYGARGESPLSFQKYQKECATHRIKADFQAFKQGHSEGLNAYCSYENGMNIGNKGSIYNAHCPSSKFPKFNQGYQDGINRYCGYERGLNTGATGGSYNASCPSSEYPKFSQGYNVGIKRHCNFEQGYQVGVDGKVMNPNCSSSKFKDYEAGYAKGHLVYRTIYKINRLKEELITLDQKIQFIHHSIERTEKMIVSDNSTVKQRKQALAIIKDQQSKLNQLEQAYHEAENEIMYLEAELNKSYSE